MRGLGFFVLGIFGWMAVAQGCSKPQDGDQGYERERIGDTIHVHNLTPLHVEPARLEPELRIGMMEGPSEYLFVDIYSLAVGPRGEIYVGGVTADGGIRRFSREGVFEGWVARAGPGPMEVGMVTGLTVNGEGVVAARDRSARRVKLFFPDGRFQSFLAYPDPERYHEDALQYRVDGTLWAGINPPLYQVMDPIPYPRPIYVRISEQGELVDTIFAPERLGEGCLLGDNRFIAGVWQDLRDPWFPLGKWALGPGGTLALGCPADYAFEVIREGRPVLRISREWAPVKPSPGEEEQRRNRPLMYSWARQLPAFPDQRPAYARIILPGDGRVWVWPTHPSVQRELPPRHQALTGRTYQWRVATQGSFDVFREDGRWLGRVRLPAEMGYNGYHPPHVVIRGDTLWAAVADSLDVEYVARYRVVWP